MDRNKHRFCVYCAASLKSDEIYCGVNACGGCICKSCARKPKVQEDIRKWKEGAERAFKDFRIPFCRIKPKETAERDEG